MSGHYALGLASYSVPRFCDENIVGHHFQFDEIFITFFWLRWLNLKSWFKFCLFFKIKNKNKVHQLNLRGYLQFYLIFERTSKNKSINILVYIKPIFFRPFKINLMKDLPILAHEWRRENLTVIKYLVMLGVW